MASYRLSNRADGDFEAIFMYGVLTFGLRQAEEYALGLAARFEKIAHQPCLYRKVDHIKRGCRLSVYNSHSIYYRIDQHGVLIVRILRNQDAGIALTAEPE